MRLLATILSFYVLLLAFMPCADEFSIEDIREQTCQIQDDCGSDEAAHQKSCTPFCHCHCCHSHVTFLEMDWHSQPFSPYSEKHTLYTRQKECIFPFSIFQPPRV
ncbi:hypothetical protein OKW21_000557 [Catalinimonas alkaloidigena]|uniref:DUF6660 family protein n=1 Tax=Catalinimonas alkaloidigena TaxID=1075417 RepID=UPI0024076995|nr:DUF6660 family protein [Catalinimonas alkaloidigena]MDF9795294.1 hypothetical protein [Catalinimonas alkaloidigena]